ncbi:hypothetical protein V6N13_101120 [Hibiscus sabdariffa]|uniref:Uncharacterized protein n=1 Tax=Hibiscus sabdariffa TaxID=183260 RepID=A0ABR2QKT8_9ROSI
MNSYCVISTSIKPSLLVPSKFQKFLASLLDSKGVWRAYKACVIVFEILDASWYMPDEQSNPIQEYQVLIFVYSTIYFGTPKIAILFGFY